MNLFMIVYGCSHFTTRELGRCNRYLMVFEKIYYLAFYRKKFADSCSREWGEILLSYLVTVLFFVSALRQEFTL